MSSYSHKILKDLKTESQKLPKTYLDLSVLLAQLGPTLNNPEAKEFLLHGFLRRLQTLKRCLENIWKISPPENSSPLLDEARLDLCINLQCFVFNVFGCIDNLAWVWIKEKGFTYSNQFEVSFYNKEVKKLLRPDLQKLLDTIKNWHASYLQNYRHALGHRIPLYVAPFSITSQDNEKFTALQIRKSGAMKRLDLEEVEKIEKEELTLGKFIPLMIHSFSEQASPVYFHGQFLADWNTVVALAKEVTKEL